MGCAARKSRQACRSRNRRPERRNHPAGKGFDAGALYEVTYNRARPACLDLDLRQRAMSSRFSGAVAMQQPARRGRPLDPARVGFGVSQSGGICAISSNLVSTRTSAGPSGSTG